jgi:hypothetical protein
MKLKITIILVIVFILLISIGVWAYQKNSSKASITIVSPNGGEVLPYASISMAGDLTFTWTTSLGEKYKPTNNLKRYIIDTNGNIVRDDILNTIIKRDGISASSFIGEYKLSKNVKYKIKICDSINNNEVCDTSDDYFILQ